MKKLLDCAMDIGELMLLSGAEVHRVEDTMGRICRSFGATRVDVFIITSSMVTTIHCPNGNVHTQTRRIKSLGTDFHRLDQLNKLSRKICTEKMEAEEISAEVARIRESRVYPLWLQCVAYAVIAAAFTVIFGGGWQQTLVSLVIGGLLRFVVLFADRVVKNMIFSKFVSSTFLTAMAFLALFLHMIPKVDEVIIGNIMLLIQGLGFTNALRDLFTGDSVSGILRCLEAVLSAVAIAAGYFLFVLVIGGAAV